MEASRVRLRALEGIPLADPVVRDMVVATANAIAERTGINLAEITTEPDSITVTLTADKLAALGFLAELRRLTSAWYEKKFREGPLWGEPPRDAPPWEAYE